MTVLLCFCWYCIGAGCPRIDTLILLAVFLLAMLEMSYEAGDANEDGDGNEHDESVHGHSDYAPSDYHYHTATIEPRLRYKRRCR